MTSAAANANRVLLNFRSECELRLGYATCDLAMMPLRLSFNGVPLPTLREVVDKHAIHGVHSAFAGCAMSDQQFYDFEIEFHNTIREKIQERLKNPNVNWVPMLDICLREAESLVGFSIGAVANPRLGGLEPEPKRIRLRPRPVGESFAAFTSRGVRRVRFDCMVSIVEIPDRIQARRRNILLFFIHQDVNTLAAKTKKCYCYTLTTGL